MRLLKPLLFSIFLLTSCHSISFSQPVSFDKVVSSVGGFANFVGGITQDANGYMWFATSGGLYKYDGYRFKRYTNSASDSNSLSSTHLETLIADHNGKIWIATWVNGVDLFDPVTEKFIHFKTDPKKPAGISSDTIRAILEDHEGIIWIGTHKGLDRYDPVTKEFQHYRHDPNDRSSLSCDRVRAIYEDKQNTLWVGTGSTWQGESAEPDEGGLNRFDRKTGKFISYLHDPNDAHSLINNKVRAIFEDSEGNFWVGTAGDGLHTMNRATGSFERHTYDPAHPEKLSRPPVQEGDDRDHITFITEDALHNIWIGTLGNGINKYDPKLQTITHYGHADSSAGFVDNSGWCSYNSRDGVLWMSAWQGNLYRVDPHHKNIPHFFAPGGVSAFTGDSENNIWIGTRQGLVFKDARTGSSRRFVRDSNKNTISSSDVSSLCTDNDETIWVGTENGLNHLNLRSGNFTRYVNEPGNTSSITGGTVYCIQGGADKGHLWVGTNEGLNLMDKQTGRFVQFKNDPKDTNSLTSNIVAALLPEKSGDLWVGIYLGGGLNYFNHTTAKFSHFLKGLSVFSLLRDASGILWVATDDGIYKENETKGFAKTRYVAGGIELTDVLSIQEDNQKNIWAASSLGIFKIDRLSGQVNVYGSNYGINGGDLRGLAGYKSNDGKIYFGTVHGYYLISPNDFTINTRPPQIILTGVNVSGEPVLIGGKSAIGPSLETTKKISLRYNQNVFTLEFAGIHYSNPENNYHLYMLEDFDQAWHVAGTEKSASYFNVPPGRYVFHMKAANSDGIWAEKTIDVIISPPWWRTWWAYCVYGLVFIVAVLLVHRYQSERVLKKERERTRERELVQAKEIEKAYQELKTTQTQLIQQEKMASLGELTAGIAHEIQNPLNFVNNFSEVNSELIAEMKNEINKGNLDEARSIAKSIDDNEQKIMFHGKRADAIVKSMLQHSRTSSGHKELTDINALADEYLRLAYHGLRAKDKSFNAAFKTDFDNKAEKINVIPQDIGRVLLNLINNAFYAVDEKVKHASTSSAVNGYEPTIIVSTKKVADEVLITVADNGNGIPQKVLDKIFQPFFTTKPAGEGTGLGLSLSYDIIRAHGGNIRVETKQGEGSEFVIILPVNS
jgi:signal transduction histidine kinase/ligand-binding sensor domain-containing protein